MSTVSKSKEHSLRNYIVWTAGFILLVAGFIAAKALLTPKQKPMARHAVSVTIAKSIRKDVERYMEAVGSCVAELSIDIIPEVNGRIIKVYYPHGGWVKKDTPLFEIDNATYMADLAQAKAQLTIDQAKLSLHQSQLDRSSELLKGNFVSRQDYDTYKANVEEAKARIELDLAIVERKTIDLDRCVVKAPADGLLSLSRFDVGQIANDKEFDSQERTLANLRQMRPLYIDFSLSEKYFFDVYQNWQLSRTLPVIVTSLDNPTIRDEGELIFIDNYIDPQTLNFNVRAAIKNTDLRFWPGGSVNVHIKLEKHPSAILVPEEAVQLGQQGHFVFVVDESNTAQVKPVVPGQIYDGWITIEQGLTENERVVTDGHIMLFPGAPVSLSSS